jgi:hypothetical protein
MPLFFWSGHVISLQSAFRPSANGLKFLPGASAILLFCDLFLCTTRHGKKARKGIVPWSVPGFPSLGEKEKMGKGKRKKGASFFVDKDYGTGLSSCN